MTVGSLGDVVFSVSAEAVRTIKNLSWKISANYSVHKMHGRKGILEFTGQDPDEIEFEADVFASLGVNPMEMIDNLRGLIDDHSAVKLVLGTDVIGSSWVVTDLEISAEQFFQDGTMMSASFKIKIKECVEE